MLIIYYYSAANPRGKKFSATDFVCLYVYILSLPNYVHNLQEELLAMYSYIYI